MYVRVGNVKRRKVAPGRARVPGTAVRRKKLVRRASVRPKARLAKLTRAVRTLQKDNYEQQQYRFSYGATTLTERRCDPILGDLPNWYRMFSASGDSFESQRCWVNSLKFEYRLQITNNTPKSNPIWITMFFVSPKWAYRQSVGSSVPTSVQNAQLAVDVHYSFGITSHAMPVLNREFFHVHAVRRHLISPQINSLTASTVEAIPQTAFRKGAVWFKPRMLVEAIRNSSWRTVPLDDLPFTKQIYCITFANYSEEATQPASIPFVVEHMTTAYVNQVRGV